MEDFMAALSWMYKKPLTSNNVFLMKKLFNMKMGKDGSVAEHQSEFNTVSCQLSSIGINFEDEVRALVLLSSLL